MKKNKGLYKKEILKIESERLEKESEELQKKYDERFALLEDFIKNEISEKVESEGNDNIKVYSHNFVKPFIKDLFKNYKYLFDEEISRLSDKFLLRAIGKNEPSRTGDKFRNAERNFRDFESFIDHLPNEDAKSFTIEFFRDSKHIIFNDVLDKLESILYKVKKKSE